MPLVLAWGKSFEIFNTSPTPLSHCVSHCDKRSWCCYHETICIDSPTPTTMIERENIFRMSKDYTKLGTHCSLEATLASPRVHRSTRSNRLIKLILREHNPCVICQRWPAQVSQNSHIICFLLGFGNRSSEPLFSPWPPQHWISVHQMYKQFYPRKHKCFMMYQICWYIGIILAFILGLLLLKEKRQFKTWGRMFPDPSFQLVPAAL